MCCYAVLFTATSSKSNRRVRIKNQRRRKLRHGSSRLIETYRRLVNTVLVVAIDKSRPIATGQTLSSSFQVAVVYCRRLNIAVVFDIANCSHLEPHSCMSFQVIRIEVAVGKLSLVIVSQ